MFHNTNAQAHCANVLLDGEDTAEFAAASAAEQRRMVASRLQRERSNASIKARLAARPLNNADLHGAKLFVDPETRLPADWSSYVFKHQISVVQEVHEANLFVAANPFNPTNCYVTFAAHLMGALVVSPAAITREAEHGAFVAAKCNHALAVKRNVWISPGFRTEHPRIWILLLELMTRRAHKWSLLNSADHWAVTKALAMRKKRSAEVIALLSNAEHVEHAALPHVYTYESYLASIKKMDWANGEIGLLGM